MRDVYYPEMEALVKRETGASHVVIFDHTIRHADKPLERGLRAPVQNVHNDYTEKSGPQRVRELVGEEAAAPLLKRRFAEYNVWRPIAGPVKSWPLALVDAQHHRATGPGGVRAGLSGPRRRDLYRRL